MKKFGNSLVEYIIPVSLVGAVVLFSVALLNNNFTTFIQSSMNGQVSATSKSLILTPYGTDPILSDKASLRLPDGSLIKFSIYPNNLAERVEALGGSGATEELLATLDSLIAELARTNQLTPEEFLAFQELSNQGHRMAFLESMLEKASKDFTPGSNISDFESNKVSLDNQSVTLSNLLVRLGYFELLPTSPDKEVAVSISSDPSLLPYLNTFKSQQGLPSSENSVGTELYQFLKLYQKLDEGGGLKNPAIRSIVTDLSKRIVHLSDATQDYFHFNPGQLKEGLVSTISNLDSKGICNVGQHEDDGLACH